MKLYEVKNDIAKVEYNPADNHLLPSDFLLIEDINQKLIAQIINIETSNDSGNNIADIRLVLCIDKEENLSYYSGSIPSKDSNIIYIQPEEILELIKSSESNLYIGNLSNHQECFVKVPYEFVDDKLYIQSDKKDTTAIIIKNLLTEFNARNKKVIILDFDGTYNSFYDIAKIKLSDNFKLPLNTDAFDTIYENELTDCPIEDKALIQSIILELREYLKTLKDKYIPFTTFKNVVEDELLQNPSSGLMLLRNKLWLYAQDNIFAENKSQFNSLNEEFIKSNVLLIDASKIEEKWYKFIIKTVVSIIKENAYLIISSDDINVDKKDLNFIYNVKNITPIITSSSKNKAIELLKTICNNKLLCKPLDTEDKNNKYSQLLNKLNANEFIIYGESTLYIPLIINLEEFDSKTAEEIIQNDIKKDVDKMLTVSKKIVPNDLSLKNTKPLEITDAEQDEVTDNDLDFLDELNESNDLIIEDNTQETEQKDEKEYDIFNPETEIEQVDNQDKNAAPNPQYEEKQPKELEGDILLHSEEEDIMPIAELPDEEEEETNNIELENISEEIGLEEIENETELQETEKSNKVKDDSKEEETDTQTRESNASSDNQEIDIDDLLDDNDNKSEENLNENNNINKDADNETIIDGIVNNIKTKEVNTEEVKSPAIEEQNKPKVYDTDKPTGVSQNEIPFKVGDRVFHPKHGKGVIEGFTNYSNKILFCQIEFENVGRRILDPMVAGIEKI